MLPLRLTCWICILYSRGALSKTIVGCCLASVADQTSSSTTPLTRRSESSPTSTSVSVDTEPWEGVFFFFFADSTVDTYSISTSSWTFSAFSAACGDNAEAPCHSQLYPCFQREVDVLGDLDRMCLKGRMGEACFLSPGLAALSPSWACLVLSGLPGFECVFVCIISLRCCCCQSPNGAQCCKQTSGFVVATRWSLLHFCWGMPVHEHEAHLNHFEDI